MVTENSKYELDVHVIRQSNQLAEIKAKHELISLEFERDSNVLVKYKEKLAYELKKLVGNAPLKHKTIIALNKIMGRELMQYDPFPLKGFEELINHMDFKQDLVNNAYQIEGMQLINESVVYVSIDPIEIGDEETDSDKTEMFNTYLDLINAATSDFELEGVEYTLKIFINTNEYAEYRAIETELSNYVDNLSEKIINEIPSQTIRDSVDLYIDEFPETGIEGLVDSFMSSQNLIPHRRKKIYFDYKRERLGRVISEPDFQLLAMQNVKNLYLTQEQKFSLNRYVTHLWLEKELPRFLHEEIEDFFQCPSLVFVPGLAIMMGVIVKRELVIEGYDVFESEGDQEVIIPHVLLSDAKVTGVTNEPILRELLRRDIRNTRDRLVNIDNKILRLKSMKKIVHIQGQAVYGDKIAGVFPIDLSEKKIEFLSPLNFESRYNKLIREGMNPFRAPERFGMYLKRQATWKDASNVVDSVDTKWFSHVNRELPSILKELTDIIKVDQFLGHHISPLEGIVSRTIILDLGGLQWTSAQS